MPSLDAVTATARFGLGARLGELPAAAPDPRGWLARQLVAGPARDEAALPGAAAVAAEFVQTRADAPEGEQRRFRRRMVELYRREVAARTAWQVATATPLRERLVLFWGNHFTVSARRPVLYGLVGAFEREAIRPHVAGPFLDLLRAVVRHPAMLVYLDNARSTGPRSLLGRDRGRGLNENLARELLELHTLGADGGYVQADVTELARILTGWSIGEDGRFRFRGRAHEPGPKRLLGRAYPEAGIEEGEAALRALARHPATARHLAAKLARHFVADAPPPGLVDRLACRYLDTGGDLGAVTLALIEAPEAWAEPLAKVRTPHELVLAASRALDRRPDVDGLLAALGAMGQPPFAAPSPQGWPDRADDWVSPAALLQRAEWAAATAGAARADPRALLEGTLGPAAGTATRGTVLRAGSPAEGVALLLASPEFQRR